MATAFPDVRPFPGEQSANPLVAPMGNKPPLEEAIVAEFMEGLSTHPEGIMARLEKLIAAGDRVESCLDNPELAGRYGDFIKMSAAVTKAVEAEREKHNRPLLTAQRALKSKADGLLEPLAAVTGKVRREVDAYVRDEERKAAEQRRRAQEEADRLRREQEAAAAAAVEAGQPEPEALVEIKPVEVEAPVARGDLGSRVGSTTRWKHEIISVRQLPDRILKNPRVIEALDKVIAAEVRAGARDIKGTRIFSETAASVR